ncbi:hypothetical protein CBR_g23313 [Chara braunii]|uniref:Inositol-tetrakisphosphate 1-kinase n=1 Tax=Chara braunii TaxID=69332 RepID=A0A388L412_CHABU|nr:hypothetical protein CBR_g23313 [Chara braunii]|eukprot:GBG76982.1 hypothetical protein CBR_g23313 [Chara braunii]
MMCRKHGINLVEIDRSRPLLEQGPFDVILHKLPGKEWPRELEVYRQAHPDVVVLDPPEAIQQLHNRQSMLHNVAELELLNCGGKVGIPRQLVVTGDPRSIPEAVARAGLKLPLVAKPLVADGTAKSHAMSLAYDEICLSELDPPLVLQEFVNHGGVLFKAYVVGETVTVVRRLSLPDVREGEPVGNGVQAFDRVSSAASAASAESVEFGEASGSAARLPPSDMLSSLAAELRQRLGLQLFNLDIIREGGCGDRYYVIDINYFPGYGKMPCYEYVFTDFLVGLAEAKGKTLHPLEASNPPLSTTTAMENHADGEQLPNSSVVFVEEKTPSSRPSNAAAAE